ncbi:CLUMA_CG016833, isoform A [Clunio marinus]|uniref:CLUMA_CG016833, isoform A n=1 Tax=Clunio marinus TaxID=568069 RepID=A0A1J1ISH4_9DIPT|nr:CLUMA_CG016833, isoform A [Clunio marinus]
MTETTNSQRIFTVESTSFLHLFNSNDDELCRLQTTYINSSENREEINSFELHDQDEINLRKEEVEKKVFNSNFFLISKYLMRCRRKTKEKFSVQLQIFIIMVRGLLNTSTDQESFEKEIMEKFVKSFVEDYD